MSHRVALMLLVILAGCRPDAERAAESLPLHITPAEFRSLAWLEGRWRGTQNDSNPFFEEYRFADDSTIRSLTLADSAWTRVSDSGQIRLRGGIVTTGDSASGYTLTALDSASAHFEPRGRASNAFTWRRLPDGTWSATLNWRDASGRPAERVYIMRPIGR